MSQDLSERFKVKESKRGYIELSDKSIIVMRVAIVDAKPLRAYLSSSEEIKFEVIPVTGISVVPSEEAINELKDKPVIESGAQNKGKWESLDIIKKQPAYEEVEYILGEKEKYIIRAEMEASTVSKNIDYRTAGGEPIYNVISVVKITWKKGE